MINFSFNSVQIQHIIGPAGRYLDWFYALNTYLPEYGINTKEQVAAFLAECCHESNNFTQLEENLNYSAERLLIVFPRYFSTLEDTQLYERQPMKIANRVYANRMGNGNEQSGDGWLYRGRGLIQITGKDNYIQLGIDDPNVLTSISGAVEGSCKYWEVNGLASLTDINDISRKVNGGTNGLQVREQLYNKILGILNEF